jgi:hypothetical protein
MKKPLAAFCSALALTLFSACGGSSAAGVYEVDKAAFKEAILSAMPAEQRKEKMALEQADAMVNGMSMSVDLKPDGSASSQMKMTMMGQTMEESATGTWKLDGTKLSMTMKDKSGPEETKTAEYSNGSFTVEDDQGGKKMKMVFRRK